MLVNPCSTCGYDSPGEVCPHCAERPESSPITALELKSGQRLLLGLSALPRGFSLLLITGGVKRFLLPPLILTSLAFTYLFIKIGDWILGSVEEMNLNDSTQLELEQGWFRDTVEWVMEVGLAAFAGYGAGAIVFIILAIVIPLYTFSILYEALAGPFLDEIHGRFEERWFGANPRDAIQRPTTMPPLRCALFTAGGILGGVALFLLLRSPETWLDLLFIPLPLLLLGLLHRDFSLWLRWVLHTETKTLWISAKAAMLAGLILLFLSPLHLLNLLIPPVGTILFGILAGIPTSLTLLDIPFSRRQWTTIQRVKFLKQNFFPLMAFGTICGLLFTIPFIGPIVMVPSASVGGLWLICRLDKSSLRPLAPAEPTD